jgi:hypothetical protein
VLGLDGVACDSGSQLQRQKEQQRRAPKPVRPLTCTARATQRMLLHPPDQERLVRGCHEAEGSSFVRWLQAIKSAV